MLLHVFVSRNSGNHGKVGNIFSVVGHYTGRMMKLVNTYNTPSCKAEIQAAGQFSSPETTL
jgi:hypothetical protein